MSTSRAFNGAVSWDLVSYPIGTHTTGWAIRSDAFESDAYAFFGASPSDVVEHRFEQWKTGQWGTLNFTDPDGYGEITHIKALHRPSTVEPLAGEPIGDDRTAQHEAIVTMRRRESEARQRAEEQGQRADRLQAQLSSLQDDVQRLADELLREAEERDWCAEYDRFVDEFPTLPLRARDREQDVTFVVTLSFSGSVTAPSDADLADYVDKSEIVERIREMQYSEIEYAVDDFTVE